MADSPGQTGTDDPVNEQASETARALIERRFRIDLLFWISTEPRVALRIMKLIEDAIRSPFEGRGKPEALKHERRGMWSRQITDEHRLTYYFISRQICFVAARHHY